MKRILLVLMLAPAALAQTLVATPRGVVVANEGRISLEGRWSVDGVENATATAASNDRVAVLDALRNEVVVVDLASGRATRTATAETPVAAAFIGRELYVLARDARVLQHIGGPQIPLSAGPSFLRESNGRLYVYSATTGVLEEIERDRVARRAHIAPFASDLEIAGTTAYLAYPREAHIGVVDLRQMKTTGTIDAGAVPVDIAVTGGGTALSARILAVADPSAKRVWITEGTQSMSKAVARGFLRGLLGLGLLANRSSAFPTGVDRIVARGSKWIAYDTSTRTLYDKTKVLARNVPPGAFVFYGDGVAVWQDGRVRMLR